MATTTIAAIAVLMATTITAATVALSAHQLDELLNLRLVWLTNFHDRSSETEVLACQRMVQVDANVFIGDLHDPAHETVAILVLKGNHGTLFNIVVVEMSIDGEYLTVEVHHMLVKIWAIGLFLWQCEIG